ncbi:MAG TPA: L-histidine N(alpha)-methyltransferase, partial [Longimicrobiales bacterium]|nr:L-histidine N(alpha)-methyltransferase [Longimicrobiales bacterium]
WFLVGPEEARLAGIVRRLPGCGSERLERDLLAGVLPTILETTRPRAVVHAHPDGSDGTGLVLSEFRRRNMPADYIAIGTDGTAVREAVQRAMREGTTAARGTIADPAVEMPTELGRARPRLVLCLGNALGRYTRLGAVRMLRAVRATMAPGESLLLGVDLRNDVQALEMAFNDTTGVIGEYHKRVLAAASRELNATFDVERFDFRVVYDVEGRRLEMCLVARDAHDVDVPGLGTLALRRGELIRTAASATFSRGSIAGMLTGVGFDLRGWVPDAADSYAIAVAAPAV